MVFKPSSASIIWIFLVLSTKDRILFKYQTNIKHCQRTKKKTKSVFASKNFLLLGKKRGRLDEPLAPFLCHYSLFLCKLKTKTKIRLAQLWCFILYEGKSTNNFYIFLKLKLNLPIDVALPGPSLSTFKFNFLTKSVYHIP